MDNNLVLKFELYSVKDEAILETFTDYEAKDFSKMLAVLNESLPGAFKKMIPSGSKLASQASVPGGIGGVQIKGTDYEFAGEKRYLASISSDPEGATLSFDGVPNSRCAKTPCGVELGEGNVRIIASLEHYEIADTTVSIKQNNQVIRIRMKANFGVLEIKPAYSDGIGNNEPWSLTINGTAVSSWESRLSPGKYKVELGHRCYEALSFEAGINKDKREVFDMAAYAKPKKGGLVLSAEADGKPISEPVFVNGRQVGETPFSGSVPMCSKIEIGSNREVVDVNLKYNEKVMLTVKSGSSFTDSRDGKRYKIVKIGTQTWMAENLNYNANGSKCYDNQESNCQKYGRLYDWSTATKACPSGWHLPSNGEWKTLTDFVGGYSTAGTKLKAKSGWNDYKPFFFFGNKKSGNGTDEYGFAALPGGNFYLLRYLYIGEFGEWWSVTKHVTADLVYYLRIEYGGENFITYGENDKNDMKKIMYSVRCLKD